MLAPPISNRFAVKHGVIAKIPHGKLISELLDVYISAKFSHPFDIGIINLKKLVFRVASFLSTTNNRSCQHLNKKYAIIVPTLSNQIG